MDMLTLAMQGFGGMLKGKSGQLGAGGMGPPRPTKWFNKLGAKMQGGAQSLANAGLGVAGAGGGLGGTMAALGQGMKLYGAYQQKRAQDAQAAFLQGQAAHTLRQGETNALLASGASLRERYALSYQMVQQSESRAMMNAARGTSFGMGSAGRSLQQGMQNTDRAMVGMATESALAQSTARLAAIDRALQLDMQAKNAKFAGQSGLFGAIGGLFG